MSARTGARALTRLLMLGAAVLAGCSGAGELSDAATGFDAAEFVRVDAEPTERDAPSLDANEAVLDVPQDVFAAVDASVNRFDEVYDALARCEPEIFDRWMHEVAWREGWPLRGEGQWLFATRLSEAVPSASVVGDFNGWRTNADPGTRCPDGMRYFTVVAEARASAPLVGSKYKWYVANDGSYRAPPEATQYGYDEFGRFGWVRAPVGAARMEQFPEFRSAFLAEPRAFRAYLPAGHEPHGVEMRRARTVIFHDGQNVFHRDAFHGGWRVDEALASRSGIVAVAVDNAADRMDAYTHTADDRGRGPVGGRADAYLRLVVEEALPFFRARYGLVAEGRSLAMAGSSLGGLVTLYAALRDVVPMGCVVAMSSTVGWGSIGRNEPTTLLHLWRGRHAPVYLDTGGGASSPCRDADGDGVEDDTDDSDNYCVNAQMVRVLLAAGYERDRSLRYVWAAGAPHNEAAWARRIGEAMDACSAMGWSSP